VYSAADNALLAAGGPWPSASGVGLVIPDVPVGFDHMVTVQAKDAGGVVRLQGAMTGVAVLPLDPFAITGPITLVPEPEGVRVISSWVLDYGVMAMLPVGPVALVMDIKPGSSVNPLNLKAKGVLPVAVLGTADVDVNQINPATIRLAGVSPLRVATEDVLTPAGDPDSAATVSVMTPDGIDDLLLKFDSRAVGNAIGPVSDRQVVRLVLTAELYDGTAVEGGDIVTIIAK
jgi:hypothetical protein